MGAFQASASLARVVGPVRRGLALRPSPAAPFWFASALLVAAALLARTLPRRAAADGALAAARAAADRRAGEAAWTSRFLPGVNAALNARRPCCCSSAGALVRAGSASTRTGA